MRRALIVIAALPLVATAAIPQDRGAARQALIGRAKSLELTTPYVPPPGDPLAHHASGFAKVMCSAVVVTGLDPDFAAQNVGGFTAPFAERAKLGKPVVDREAGAVHVTVPNGVTRTAKYLGRQGCLTLPIGEQAPRFKPTIVTSTLPPAETTPISWAARAAGASGTRSRC